MWAMVPPVVVADPSRERLTLTAGTVRWAFLAVWVTTLWGCVYLGVVGRDVWCDYDGCA